MTPPTPTLNTMSEHISEPPAPKPEATATVHRNTSSQAGVQTWATAQKGEADD